DLWRYLAQFAQKEENSMDIDGVRECGHKAFRCRGFHLLCQPCQQFSAHVIEFHQRPPPTDGCMKSRIVKNALPLVNCAPTSRKRDGGEGQGKGTGKGPNGHKRASRRCESM